MLACNMLAKIGRVWLSAARHRHGDGPGGARPQLLRRSLLSCRRLPTCWISKPDRPRAARACSGWYTRQHAGSLWHPPSEGAGVGRLCLQLSERRHKLAHHSSCLAPPWSYQVCFSKPAMPGGSAKAVGQLGWDATLFAVARDKAFRSCSYYSALSLVP